MAETPTAITRIAVQGFKSLYERQDVELRPLTLLAGTNSSGKSSIMQPLLLLKQTLESASDPGALLLDGPNVKFTSADQVLSHRPGMKETCEEFSVAIEYGPSLGERPNPTVGIRYVRHEGAGFDVSEINFRPPGGGNERSLRQGMSQSAIRAFLPQHLSYIDAEKLVPNGSWIVTRRRCFLAPVLVDKTKSEPNLGGMAASLFAAEWIERLIPHITGTIHLPGLRRNPQRTYPRTSSGSRFVGTFEEYAAGLIDSWQSQSVRLKELGTALEDLGLGWKVASRTIGDTQIELLVSRMPHPKRGGASDMVSIADVGLGVSQTLPLLVALIAAQPGQIVYVEQPEIHLHPRAQSKLAGVLASAAKRGVVVVAETHSAILLRAVQTLVAKDELDPTIVKLHWFERDEKTGMSAVSSSDLDEKGSFDYDWPADFDEVELEAESEYLEAVGRKSR